MIIPTRRSSAILLGLALTSIAVSTGFADATANTVQCGVSTSTDRGMLSLEGRILSPVAMSGEYRFAIRSASNGGSSNISQGGAFSAAANEATALGKVMLNVGASYEVKLDVTANGQHIVCEQDMASLK